MNTILNSDDASSVMSTFGAMSMMFSRNQQELIARSFAAQGAWLAMCDAWQLNCLKPMPGANFDPSAYLPAWMIWQNGTEQLG